MKKVKILLLYSAILLALIIFFLPKTQLYYQAEALLAEYKVFISQERVIDNGLTLGLQEGTIYYDDMAIAAFEAIRLRPWVFYNSLVLEPTELSAEMEQFVPRSIDWLKITYAVYDPLHVTIEGSGAFGSVEGSVALFDRNISLTLTPSEALLGKKPFWLGKLKKDSEGGYRYETTY
ncbi:MAG: hypothetical protein JXK05_05110 [Campylobacterales bacterium]|nr:hypothetical protein [Campylobacterales bacterium]